MLKSEKINSVNVFWIVTVSVVVVSSLVMIFLGNMVGRNIESAMILHDFFTIVAIMSGAGIIGILHFSTQTINGSITSMQVLAVLSAVSIFIVIFTGVYGYIFYRLSDESSPKSIINKTFPYAHNPMFETMEYLGLVGSIWATLIAYLVFHWKEKLFESNDAKYTIISFIGMGIVFALIISLAGIVPTKIASVQG